MNVLIYSPNDHGLRMTLINNVSDCSKRWRKDMHPFAARDTTEINSYVVTGLADIIIIDGRETGYEDALSTIADYPKIVPVMIYSDKAEPENFKKLACDYHWLDIKPDLNLLVFRQILGKCLQQANLQEPATDMYKMQYIEIADLREIADVCGVANVPYAFFGTN